MLDVWGTFKAMGRRVGLPVRVGPPHNSRRDRELLDAVWEALNIARDNKALLVACEGSIVNANHLACQLCGRSLDALRDRNVLGWLFEHEPARYSSGATERWETNLSTASGDSVAVEVTRQPLGNRFPGIEAYAIRDL